MDPRHPEAAPARVKELMAQFADIINTMGQATTLAQLSELEREGSLVVQEICLVSPRLHEAMIQASRNQRYELSHPKTIVSQPTDNQLTEEQKIVTEIAKTVKKPAKKKTAKKDKK